MLTVSSVAPSCTLKNQVLLFLAEFPVNTLIV